MSAKRRNLIASAGGTIALAATILLVPGVGAAAERTTAPVLGYDLADYAPAAPAEQVQQATTADQADDGEVRCLAKVVHHEARNQPRIGQVAVAQTLINRRSQGSRFGETLCEVANQPGQYFNTVAYHPNEDSDGWRTALSVAREALSGTAGSAAPGALFFRAAYAAPTSFFRTRQRIAAVGDHVFYR